MNIGTAKLIGAISLGIGLFIMGYFNGSSEKNKEWEVRWEKQQRDIADANLAHEKTLREREQHWQNEYDRIDQEGRKKREDLENYATTSTDLYERLRVEYEKLAVLGGTCPTSGNTSSSSSAAKAATMLSDMLKRCNQSEDTIAKYADGLEVAHMACMSALHSIGIKETAD